MRSVRMYKKGIVFMEIVMKTVMTIFVLAEILSGRMKRMRIY